MNANCAEQHNTYHFDASVYNDEMLVIQYNTVKFADIEAVMPYRDLLLVDCSADIERKLTCSLPYTQTICDALGKGKSVPAILIKGKDLAPRHTFQLMNKTVEILDEMYRPNYIVSLNQWLNIQAKSEFKRESGVFSYLTPKHKEYFTAYAHLLPFTQTFLLQYIPLGSVNAANDITAEDRNYSSNFVDYDWCTDTCYAPGEQFPGCGHDCYAFNASEYDNHSVRALNKLFGDPVNTRADGRKCNALRTIVSQSAEYENGRLSHAGCFALNPAAVWVGLTPSDLEAKIAKYKVDNELPHEFGHTYNLGDHSGSDCFAEKTRSFAYNYENGLSLPYFTTNSKQYKRDAMNSGTGDYTDYIFTSYSDYNYRQMIDYFTNSENHVRISKYIQIDPDRTYETTIVQLFRNLKDLQLYRINALLPCVIRNNPNATCPVKLTAYTSSGSPWQTLVYDTANDENKIVALPHGFYPKDGYIIVEKPNTCIFKKFFIRNDALCMPLALKAFDLHEKCNHSVNTKIISTQEELNQIQSNPDVLIGWLSECDGIEIHVRDGVWIRELVLHPANIKCINKPITISRASAWSVHVYIYPGITETIEQNTAVTYKYCNGWHRH